MKRFSLAVIGLLAGSVLSIETAAADAMSNERHYAGASKQIIWQSVMTSLAEHDIPVVAADFEQGRIRARQHNYLNQAWASCWPSQNRSFDPTHRSNLRVRSSPLYRGVDLSLEITETPSGVRLALDPHYSNVGHDSRRRAFATEIPCQSTGVLEQELFTAPAIGEES